MSGEHFEAEIRELERTLEAARAELRELEAQWAHYGVELTEVRDALAALKNSMSPLGGGAAKRRRGPGAADGTSFEAVPSVPIDPETERSIRGARRDQIIAICEQLGKGGRPFRTIDVLNRVRAAEGDVSEGVRSYTYAIVGRFADTGFLEKVGRGKWRLA